MCPDYHGRKPKKEISRTTIERRAQMAHFGNQTAGCGPLVVGLAHQLAAATRHDRVSFHIAWTGVINRIQSTIIIDRRGNKNVWSLYGTGKKVKWQPCGKPSSKNAMCALHVLEMLGDEEVAVWATSWKNFDDGNVVVGLLLGGWQKKWTIKKIDLFAIRKRIDRAGGQSNTTKWCLCGR